MAGKQMHGDPTEDERLAREIASHVLCVLADMRFFEDLDDRFAPLDPSAIPIHCTHTFENSVEILRAREMTVEDIDDVVAVLRFKGACCDCEVLYNIAEESRLKANYWQGRTKSSNSTS